MVQSVFHAPTAGHAGSIPGQGFSACRVKVKVTQSRPPLGPHGLYRPEYWNGYPVSSPGHLSNLGIEPRSPTLQEDSLPAEPLEKPKNTGVGSLSLLQQIFPTQESNQDLLHCRQIIYQLSYQGIPTRCVVHPKKKKKPYVPPLGPLHKPLPLPGTL